MYHLYIDSVEIYKNVNAQIKTKFINCFIYHNRTLLVPTTWKY